MKRVITAAALAILGASTARADVDLITVPALCGTAPEILASLSMKMPKPEMVGKGGDRQGHDIATLFAGNGYWALVATMSPANVCVVASGYNWTVAEPGAGVGY